MRMAQSGQLRGRVSETQLIELLEQVCASATWRRSQSLNRLSHVQMEEVKGTTAKKESKILVSSRGFLPFRWSVRHRLCSGSFREEGISTTTLTFDAVHKNCIF